VITSLCEIRDNLGCLTKKQKKQLSGKSDTLTAIKIRWIIKTAGCLSNPLVLAQWNQLVLNINAALNEQGSFGALMVMKLFSLSKHYIGTKDGIYYFLMTDKWNDAMAVVFQMMNKIYWFSNVVLLCLNSATFFRKLVVSRIFCQFQFRCFEKSKQVDKSPQKWNAPVVKIQIR